MADFIKVFIIIILCGSKDLAWGLIHPGVDALHSCVPKQAPGHLPGRGHLIAHDRDTIIMVHALLLLIHNTCS